MDRELRVAMALIVSRLEGLREELATQTLTNLARDANKAGVAAEDLPKRVADIYLDFLRRAQETHKPRRDHVKRIRRRKAKRDKP